MTYETATALLVAFVISGTVGMLVGWFGTSLILKFKKRKR